ncbi:MAG: aminomethyl-transferring glycine dehydrogenase, partial [Pseudomonadota bacterium]|nr:aminomethyl-transferring glycine dehydrogenase [Pseudomonadota bacterium]
FEFQSQVARLYGCAVANASMYDGSTACWEAVAMAGRVARGKKRKVVLSGALHPHYAEVVKTMAKFTDDEIASAPPSLTPSPDDAGLIARIDEDTSCVVVQYPDILGRLPDLARIADAAHEKGALLIAVNTEPVSLGAIKSPGELGADIVVGEGQSIGVGLNFGGPYLGLFAVRDEKHVRMMPGRLCGETVDAEGKRGFVLTLSTREQHIRREKATSNICTAQVLLAVMAGFYALWHGPEGLTRIAGHAHGLACRFATAMRAAGRRVRHEQFFDTVTIEAPDDRDGLVAAALEAGFNLRSMDGAVSASFDETSSADMLDRLLGALGATPQGDAGSCLPDELRRDGGFMQQPVFHSYRTETEMLRYMRSLADRDLALDRCMIPLGSCTMKLNATAEMIPVTWPKFANIHPYAPADQAEGYAAMISRLEVMLAEATGYAAVSLQPNAGSQGEFAGLLAIARYHEARGEGHRNICLIPQSAHGTNPASAAMAGMKVVVVKCDDDGNVDLEDLKAKTEAHRDTLSAIMVTYPSTHGVFEESIAELCDIVHEAGGQVYVDGANLNALVGHCSLPDFGADVSHLNLHKTFCIPHGGGGPGVGPIGVAAHLADFLPGSPLGGEGAVSAAPFGSAGILPITYAYIRMMGSDGLKAATATAILSANYMAERLAPQFPVLYTGANGRVAHECIIDIRGIQERSGISNEDVAKRLIDFGFHAPTMSFPVAGTLMIEPTESESIAEIDRFCDAMLAIADEAAKVESGEWPRDDNPLVNAPHTAEDLLSDEWNHGYSRKAAGDPDGNQQVNKYWPPVGRVDNAYGDRNLICSCPSVEEWEEAAE